VPPVLLTEWFDVFPAAKDAVETPGKKEKYSRKKQAIGADLGLTSKT
jgi:hypothetical protein